MAGRGMRVGETATEAGDTHPSGMHTCIIYILGPAS